MNVATGKSFLFQLADTLEELSIPFFLMQGTALGAYRDRGFTPTEKDIDLGVLIEHFRAGDIVKALVEQNIAVETRYRHKPTKFAHTIVAYSDEIKADVVGFHLYQDKRFTCTPTDPKNVPKPYCIVHNRAMLETYHKVELFGRKFDMPSPPEAYLESEYGPEWRTPKDDSESRLRVYGYLNTLPREYFLSQYQPNP